MNAILLRTLQPPRTPSLLAFSDYREAEQANARHSSTTATGALLEYETLELRVHPPNVGGVGAVCWGPVGGQQGRVIGGVCVGEVLQWR